MSAQEGAITAIEPIKGRAGRVAVYIDGAIWAELDAELVARGGLVVGEKVTASRLDAIIAQDASRRARERAIRLLETRERSCRELQARLQQAGFSPPVIAETLDWLRSLGYLDDVRFARRYALEKYKRGYGISRIRGELGRRGISSELADQILDELMAEECGTGKESAGECPEPLIQEVRRRFGRAFAQDKEKTSRRIAGFLMRRGHDWDMVHSVIRLLENTVGLDDCPAEEHVVR
ncbi:MAG: recombination regulator RecX [Thermoleophilia bacterium]|nr:recombination regulator RecX [Thermoleophilia bacterium]